MSKYQHLFDFIDPSNYKLELKLYPEEKEFSGSVSISAISKTERSSIQLHQHELNITKTTVNGAASEFNTDDKNDLLNIHTRVKAKQKLNIYIEFSGVMTAAMNGIYPSTNLGKTIIGTQFESHHAREAFPCIDEPAAKATFDLTLSAPTSDDVFISNTLALEEEVNGNEKTVRFKTTPVMSTYLLAFVHGDLEKKQSTTKNGTVVMAWATPDKVAGTTFALDVAIKSLEFFEDYFEIPYPLKHCHHIALPDFAAGAMENWGCITYRESQMLVDENTPVSMKKAVAITVAHEIAHQWFGNLVTMEWWTDLWLNEGFASWISVLAIDEIFPEWKVWDDFVTDDVIRAIELDSLNNSHPIEVEIDKPEEIRGIFDAISYSKGASVIRMLNNYLGKEEFRKGLGAYLNKYSYNNAVTADLWDCLEDSSDKPVQELMQSWTKQTGFPLVKAKLGSNKITYTQEKFARNVNSKKPKWNIPLYDGSGNQLKSANTTIKYADGLPEKINNSQSAPYLVSYDQKWQKKINKKILNGALDSKDVAGYIYERSRLAQFGKEDTVNFLEAVSSIKDIEQLAIWQVAAGELGRVKKVMSSQDFDDAINKFIDDLSINLLTKLGYEQKPQEPETIQQLRTTLLGLSAGSKNNRTIKWAQDIFEKVDSFESIDSNHRSIILSTNVRHGDNRAFDRVAQAYEQTNNAQLKVAYCAALMSSKDSKLIESNLDAIKTERVKLQEVGYWIAFGLRNRYSREQTWHWLKLNWEWIVQSFGRDIMSFAYFPIYVGKNTIDQNMLNDLTSFFDAAHTDGIERQVDQAIEFAEIYVNWRENDQKKLLDYFNHH